MYKGNFMRTVFLLLPLLLTNAVWAYKPGLEIIRETPGCKTQIIQGTTASGNTLRARYWTDGKVQAPMLPFRPWLVKGPECGEIFWIDEARELGKRLPNSKDRKQKWPDAQMVKPPSETEIIDFLSSVDLPPKKELYARRLAWWLANDAVRKSGVLKAKFSISQERNLKALAKLLNEDEQNHRIMKAEIYRELGMFTECIELLKIPLVEDRHNEYADLIVKLARKKIRMVYELKD
jgi:hypothetical protein